ncbi:MAG TPA: cytochrome c oxidase assembly protein [Solirubrobacteraceae bacterium]|nr:cytochrome c oxidase assembly protein [Solirubrobacteraceae bacterium]
MIASAPNLLALPFEHWESEWAIDAEAAVACALYAWGVLRVRRWRAVWCCSFLAGVGIVLVALQSGVDAYDDRLLSDHMVQHMLLLFAAPPLLLLGRPVTLALRGPRRHALARVLIRARPLTNPYVLVPVFSLVLLLTHLTGFYEVTLRHQLVHDFEHAIFLAVGLLFWTPLLDANPLATRRLGGVGRLVYVLAAMPAMAAIGAYLNRSPTLVYPAYGPPARALGVSALADQAQAGAIMWVGGGVTLVAAGLYLAMAAMSAEERRLQARELAGAPERAGAGGVAP